jgi:CelD/BcsL family acetyltransferase involved in cellulose biosynthesis
VNSKRHLMRNDKYSIKAITDLSEFKKLNTVWNNLAEKQGAFMPFLCFDWFKVWLEHFLKDNKLLILLLYKESELVTIAPYLIKEEKFKRIGVRKIDLIGNVYSPFRYFVFSELSEEERLKNLSFIFQFLSKNYRNWDIVDLSGIQEEKNCFDILRIAIERGGLKYTDFVCYGDWYLDEIECSGDEYFNRLPEKIRKDVSYCKRRLQKMGKYEFKLIRNGDEIDHYMDLYYEVYSKSWQEMEGVGPNFHRDLAKMAVKNDWLRLGFLFFNNFPIASQFWLICNDTAYILKTVYDQEFKKHSPGKILTSEMMKYVIDVDRAKTVDYVQGDEPYKENWTPKRRERKGLVGFNNNIKGKYLELLTNKIQPVVNNNQYLGKVKEIIKSHFK